MNLCNTLLTLARIDITQPVVRLNIRKRACTLKTVYQLTQHFIIVRLMGRLYQTVRIGNLSCTTFSLPATRACQQQNDSQECCCQYRRMKFHAAKLRKNERNAKRIHSFFMPSVVTSPIYWQRYNNSANYHISSQTFFRSYTYSIINLYIHALKTMFSCPENYVFTSSKLCFHTVNA